MFYYTADLHLSMPDIIEKANRPFESVDEMNHSIIQNFNEVLDKDDILMILGDVSSYGNNPAKLLKEIHGKKVLITGNHDAEPLKHHSFRDCFVDIRDHEIIRDGDYKIYLSHYPMAEWDGFYRGIYHFYGHVHGSDQGAGYVMSLYPNAVNVGVDVNDFRPKTADMFIKEREISFSTMNIPKEFLEKVVHAKNLR